MSEMNLKLVGAECCLDWWETLVPIYDTYGLPIDIIYCKIRDITNEGQLTVLSIWPDMTSDEFYKNFLQAVQFKQCGGWRKVKERIEQRLNNDNLR